jgi:hypothetical protein
MPKGLNAKVKVQVHKRELDKLRSKPELVLRELDEACRVGVNTVMDRAAFLVPEGEETFDYDGQGNRFDVPIKDSAFRARHEGYNLGAPLSTTWVGGYSSEHAPFAHEGKHWGIQKGERPRWLAKAFKSSGAKSLVRKRAQAAFQRALTKIFPKE